MLCHSPWPPSRPPTPRWRRRKSKKNAMSSNGATSARSDYFPSSPIRPASNYHEYCSTLIKGKPSTCGMCGELILHYGNGKVHENCRRIRDKFSEGCAKALLHDSTKKRLEDEANAECEPPLKAYKSECCPPPLPLCASASWPGWNSAGSSSFGALPLLARTQH